MKEVHRIWASAAAALERIAAREGKKPSEVLSQLVLDYEAGLEFPAPASSPGGQERDQLQDDED